MKILLLLLFGIFAALASASDDQVTELPTPIPVAKLMAPHGLAKREAVVASAPKSSSSESSEEKESSLRDSTIAISTAVTPIGVIEDKGLPIVESGLRKRRETTVTETQKSEDIAAPVTEIPAADAPKIVAKRSEEEFRQPVTEPPKAAVTPEGKA
uniref:Uncharacterized protein n=1 Tax=Panagrolaimus superbus TaxID=310955 RepID=A0A914XU82_9BILA